jgi:hypothetical protein
MMVNPLTGRRSTGSRVAAFALIFAAAVVLSTATVLGLRWRTCMVALRSRWPAWPASRS